MVDLNPDTVRFIIDKAHEFQMLDGDAVDDTEGPDPAQAELKATIEDLEPDQQVTLIGIMWVGRGDYSAEEWERCLAQARARWNGRTADYLIGTPLLSDYLTEGLDQLGYPPE